MSILIVNSKDDGGGAAKATYRLCSGLREHNIDASMLVRKRTRDQPFIHTPKSTLQKWYARSRLLFDGITISGQISENSMFSLNRLPDRIPKSVDRLDPDVVHLHWIGAGYVRPESLTNIEQPLVWTMHDMWPFTGGCHYSLGCQRYENTCKKCPILNSNDVNDKAYRLYERKNKAWEHLDLTIISPSEWLAECARRSSLLNEEDIHVIPNGIDITEYKPTPKLAARQSLGLSKSENIVLFSGGLAGSSRKGQQFVRGLFKTGWDDENLCLATFGGCEESSHSPKIDIAVYQLGYLSDDELKKSYSAADILLIPSLADNQPNTIMEAMACGTPCVAFDRGGIPEMINHKKDGYLANGTDIEDLRRGIKWILEDRERLREVSKAARETIVQKYTLSESIQSHLQIYSQLK